MSKPPDEGSGSRTKQNNLAESLIALVDLAKMIASESAEIAKAKKALYDAYVEVGFTPEQALQLVKPQQGSII